MKRNIMFVLALILSVFSFSTFAITNLFVPKAPAYAACSEVPVADETKASFCKEFEASVGCQNPDYRGHLKDLHTLMVETFGDIHDACVYGMANGYKMPSVEACVQQWTCYMSGGSVNGGQCSGTGNACPGAA